MIKENNGVTLTNDEAMEIIAQLEGFNSLLCREILSGNSEDNEVMKKLRIIANMGMIENNDNIIFSIYKNTENITSCETFNSAKCIIRQAIEYKKEIMSLIEEARNENQN